MTAQTYTITSAPDDVVNYTYFTIEATVSQNDTIPVVQLASVTDSFCMNKATGAVITTTEGTNIITISGAATSAKVVVFVFGVKA